MTRPKPLLPGPAHERTRGNGFGQTVLVISQPASVLPGKTQLPHPTTGMPTHPDGVGSTPAGQSRRPSDQDKTSLVNCTFGGGMNGCVWFGDSDQGRSGVPSRNVLRDNDFSLVQFGDNVGWRRSFPLQDQRWSDGYTPHVDG